MITINELSSAPLSLLIFSYMNMTKEKPSYFEFSSSYKSSKAVVLTEEMIEENISALKNILQINDNLCLRIGKDHNNATHYYRIEKNSDIDTKQKFFDYLYKLIQLQRVNIDDETFKTTLLLNTFLPRGSIDLSRAYITVDIYRTNYISDKNIVNTKYFSSLIQLLLSCVDSRLLNLNFRELQEDFHNNNKKRNTQIRINKNWFFQTFTMEILNYNIYKYNILEKNHLFFDETKLRDNQTIFRSNSYLSNIAGKNLSANEIQILKTKYNFISSDTSRRNTSIIKLAKLSLPEECICCKDEYSINDRTFKYRNSDMYYLEIHHVISFANNSVDELDNLVKICPSCHRALSKNRAEEKYQKKLIKNILINDPKKYNYISIYIDGSLDEKVNYVYNLLK